MPGKRISLVCRSASTPDRDWNMSGNSSTRLLVTEEVNLLTYAINSGWQDFGVDVERIIIDRLLTADGFLQLLAELPSDFLGDMLYIRDDGCGYLSASMLGSGRAVYSLAPQDVRFYLETAGVVTSRIASTPIHCLQATVAA